MAQVKERSLIKEIQLKSSFCNEVETIVKRMPELRKEYSELNKKYFNDSYASGGVKVIIRKMAKLKKEYIELNLKYLNIISKKEYQKNGRTP